MRYAWFVAGVALCACLSAVPAEQCQMPPECKDGCVLIPVADAVRMYQIIDDWMSKHRT